MADTTKKDTTKFYRCASFSALIVTVDGERRARFEPYLEKFAGDNVKVGYRATDDEAVQKALSNDGNVEEVEKKDFEKATGPKSFKLPSRVL